MQLTSIISTSIDKLKRRLVKIRRFGNDDVLEPFQANNYGIDSNPIRGMVAVYSDTSENGKNVIIGYLLRNQLADVGETRMFSTDADGNLKTFIWLKNDGKMQLGGDANFAVKFNELKTEFNKLKSDFNNHLTEYNTHTHLGVTVGSGATGITTPSTNTNTSNIDNAKNANILTS